MKLGYMARDQYGQTIHLTDADKSPRQQLMENTGATTCSKMYVDRENGSSAHIGYIIRGM